MTPLTSTDPSVSTRKNLLDEFPEVTYADWRKSVESELKGVPFEKKLVSRTFEGINLQPLYTSVDLAGLPHLENLPGFPPYVRGRSALGHPTDGWDISQELCYPSAPEFNEAAQSSIERGVTAINMVLDKATRDGHDPDWSQPGEVGVGGLSIATLDDLDRALQGIDLEKISLFIRSGSSAMPFAALLMALVRGRKISPEKLQGCIEMDPLGVISHQGLLPQSLAGAYQEMAILTRWCAQKAPKLKTICVHTRAWHESGGTAVQELAFSLATAVEYLREMNNRKLNIDTVAPRIRFAYTVGTNFFMEIAKLRAARLLWSQVVSAAGGNDLSQKLKIHARTSHINKTKYDPYVNLLRTTVESFAAVLGGCDSLQVGPFDEVIRTPDDFSRRLARNTQLILQKECDLSHVIDPAGGSWYVEKLTDELARKAWNLFQDVERLGGMHAALVAGFPQSAVNNTSEERKKALATRRITLVGTTTYANVSEQPLTPTPFNAAAFHTKRERQIMAHRTQSDEEKNQIVLSRLSRILDSNEDAFEACIDAVRSGATLGEITRAIRIDDDAGDRVVPVSTERLASDYEKLRGAVDAFAEKKARPHVYLMGMGPLSQHKLRADFARSFFEVAGLQVVSSPNLATPEEGVLAAAVSAAPIVVLCSTDETYPSLVPQIIPAIRKHAPTVVTVLAGYPEDQISNFKAAGISEFIHIKANRIETLKRILAKIGISAEAGGDR